MTESIFEYKCPCCDASLSFREGIQKMKCAYCDNEFDLETVRTYQEENSKQDATEFQWDVRTSEPWTEEDQTVLQSLTCPSCGGELITDSNTAATFCPYCENPAVLPGRVTGGLKPDGVIPFSKSKEDAKAVFKELCKGKPLLPKLFIQEHRIEKISGIYVPFWLYDCDGRFSGQYRATRVHHWSDAKYNYTRTEHFLLSRAAKAAFADIPMDASQKMDNAIMESIEPFDISQKVDFDTAYLSGFFADKYDVESDAGEDRIKERINVSLESVVRDSMMGFSSVVPVSRQLQVTHGKAEYVLLPVWMLHTRYRDKTYVFAMNGQTGKMTGTFPVCPKRTAAWFGGIFAAVTAIVRILLLAMG